MIFKLSIEMPCLLSLIQWHLNTDISRYFEYKDKSSKNFAHVQITSYLYVMLGMFALLFMYIACTISLI